ncbi:MAG: NAD(P)-dependent alcohol dehydrogenase [Corynebacterium sp.]|nr:NAD(P)-dependent alcohol dehydrogenase [Corynebacterium sp.]
MTTTHEVRAWGTTALGNSLEPVTITRRTMRDNDVRIRIEYAGICHSDIHTMYGDWGERQYPLVPGHEIVGIVEEVGSDVSKFKVGQRVGVGCFVNSCEQCEPCEAGEQGYCVNGVVATYGGTDKYTDGEYTQGGYSQEVIVQEHFVLNIPEAADAAATAPLLCAGITTYSPLKHWGAGPGKKVGIIGVGGLGHVGVKIAAALGAEVIAFSQSDSKKDDALKFGASRHVASADGLPEDLVHSLDLLINTVSADLNMDEYLNLLAFNGTFVQLGLPQDPMRIAARSLTQRRISVAGSLVGGIPETQEMLDFCAEHGIGAEIELIDAHYINEAYKRTVDSDVRYRFVIDAESF